MTGQDGPPGPEAILQHQVLDEAAPEKFVPVDEPGPGIMPGKQEQQAREQQGRRRRPGITAPGGPGGEQGKADRQERRAPGRGQAPGQKDAQTGQ